MPYFKVEVPFKGIYSIDVEAPDESTAVERARGYVDEEIQLYLSGEGEYAKHILDDTLIGAGVDLLTGSDVREVE